MKLFLFYPGSEDLQMSNSINSALGAGASEAAARVAVVEAKPNGGFDETRFQQWSATEISNGDISLPDSRAALFMGRAFNLAIPYPF